MISKTKYPKLKAALIKATPMGLTLILVLITFAPSHLAGVFFINPPLPLILIYLWAITYCEDFSYGNVFAIGLITDIFDNTLFGLHTFSYLIFFYLSMVNRKFMAWKSFKFVWVGFASFSFISLVLEWTITCIDAKTLLSFSPLLFSWFALLMMYPVIFWGGHAIYTKVRGD